MKSKVIMTVSRVGGFAIFVILKYTFESVGLDTQSYNSSTEETEANYLSFYCAVLGVLLGMRTHWLLTGKTERNGKIELRVGWWYWLVGSTVCIIAIYLVELIGIQSSNIEGVLELVIGLIITFYFYQHFESKIKCISAINLSEDIIEVVDEMESSNTLKDFKTVLTDTAYENWKEETKDRIKHIRKFIVDGQVKFEDVEEVGYEIESFLNTAEEWEVEDDDRIYDFTTEARQLLNNLNASSVGQDKD